MSNIQFDGDLKQISDKQIKFISNTLEERGYGAANVMVRPVGKPGDNYTANVKRIVAKQDGKMISIVAKIAPVLEALRKMANTKDVFVNEHLLYNEVLPKYSELEEAFKIPPKDRLRYAECYGSFLEAPHEVILLEDLQVSGFTMLDKCKSLTDEEIRIVLKNFARFHSYSYALKHLQPATFQDFKLKLIKLWKLFSASEAMMMYLKHLTEDVTGIFAVDKYKNGVKMAFDEGMGGMVKLYDEDFDSEHCAIQQGDAWTNNIMFRQKDGKSTECCMIDYQQSRISAPAADLLYMLFNCSDYETRSKHFHSWVEFYYNQLEEQLAYFDLKAKDVYPKKDLQADMKRHGMLSLAQSIMLTSVLIRETAEAAQLQNAIDKGEKLEDIMESFKISAMNEECLTKFKKRVEGLIDSHIEFGLVALDEN